uniref:Uncharacterized protein n=1 Tax=Lygus hesperus TaxID=30085 RepID=A0A0A9YEW4_LYGHE
MDANIKSEKLNLQRVFKKKIDSKSALLTTCAKYAESTTTTTAAAAQTSKTSNCSDLHETVTTSKIGIKSNIVSSDDVGYGNSSVSNNNNSGVSLGIKKTSYDAHPFVLRKVKAVKKVNRVAEAS